MPVMRPAAAQRAAYEREQDEKAIQLVLNSDDRFKHRLTEVMVRKAAARFRTNYTTKGAALGACTLLDWCLDGT